MTKVFYRPGAPTPFGVAASAVLIEVPGGDQADLAAVFGALPPGQTISASLNGAGSHKSVHLAWEGVTIQPGDVVLIRTGTARYWGEDGADHKTLAEHDSAGVNLEATRWLVEDQGAMMVGADNSGYEAKSPTGKPYNGLAVHRYLLVDQGVHIAEFHNLEGLSKAKAYTFCYSAAVNKIKGTVAGFALRPLALR